MMKYIGLTNTGKRVAVVFMSIPEREDHCLVVETDNLPERIHDPLMAILQSREAQNAKNFGEVLSRRYMPDNGSDMLSFLHFNGRLYPTPQKSVFLTPKSNIKVSLAEVYNEIKMMESNTTAPQYPQNPERGIYNENIREDKKENSNNTASNLLLEADMLEGEALRKRQEAYRLAPWLNPLISRENVTEKSTLEQDIDITELVDRKTLNIDVGDLQQEEAKEIVENYFQNKIKEQTLDEVK